MHFRLRYSLLTLLILTALVAGGVKLWRGPHQAVFEDPPTEAEELLLKPFRHIKYHYFFVRNELTFRYEIEWAREWDGDRVMSLKLIPLQEVTLASGQSVVAVFERLNLADCKLLVTPSLLRETDAPHREELIAGERERVVCLLHRGRDAAGMNPLYALTEQKKIYELTAVGVSLALAGKPVTLAQVDDKDLRAKIATELANIPNLK